MNFQLMWWSRTILTVTFLAATLLLSSADGKSIKLRSFHLMFEDQQYKTFFECLCNSATTFCRQAYNIDNSPDDTNAIAHTVNDTEITTSKPSAGHSNQTHVVCSPGIFPDGRGYLSCVRSDLAFEWCRREEWCWRYKLMCSGGCISVGWTIRALETQNIEDSGFEREDTKSCPLSDTIKPVDRNNQPSDSDSDTNIFLIIFAAFGWVLFLTAAVIAAVLFRKLFRLKQVLPSGDVDKKPNPKHTYTYIDNSIQYESVTDGGFRGTGGESPGREILQSNDQHPALLDTQTARPAPTILVVEPRSSKGVAQDASNTHSNERQYGRLLSGTSGIPKSPDLSNYNTVSTSFERASKGDTKLEEPSSSPHQKPHIIRS